MHGEKGNDQNVLRGTKEGVCDDSSLVSMSTVNPILGLNKISVCIFFARVPCVGFSDVFVGYRKVTLGYGRLNQGSLIDTYALRQNFLNFFL